MARVEVLSTTQNTATVRIVELSAPQNQYGGFRVRITGQTWYTIPVTSSTGTSTGTYTITGLAAGTATAIEGQGQWNGVWYSVESAYAVTQRPRPSSWSWYSNKYSGGYFNITAGEWNAFCIRINEFREYKGLSQYPFTYALSGRPVTATQYNEARNAINVMNTNIPVYRNSGDIIYASDLNHLMIGLNGVT